MPINVSSVPRKFQAILSRIASVLNANVEVKSFDDEWLNFNVAGYSDKEALCEIESKKNRVLVGTDGLNFRILCPWDPSSGQGLWLHSLRDSDTPHDYLMGNWYY